MHLPSLRRFLLRGGMLVRRVFEGACEVLFPTEGKDAKVPSATRVKHALEVVARARPSVVEQWGARAERRPPAHAA